MGTLTMTTRGAVCGVFLGLLLQSAEGAAVFSFSYAFGNGTSVAGSFEGVAAGNYVTDVSNIVLTINGNNVGPVNVWGFYGELAYAMSFDSSLANFWFTDVNGYNGSNGGENGEYGFGLIGSTIATPNALMFGNDFEYVFDQANAVPETPFPGTPMNDSWSLTPEPSSALLTLLGLGALLGRRRAAME